MKLLQKREIDKSKAIERKNEIDNGLNLAKSVDALREQLAKEKTKLLEWRDNTIKQVQYEVDQLIETKSNLDKQCSEARIVREKLLEPLDKEWVDINKAKMKIAQDITENFVIGEQLKEEESKLEDQKIELSKIIANSKQNEKDTIKAKQETVSLKDMAQREYEMAKAEHDTQTHQHEKALSEAYKLKESYENGININEIQAQKLKEIEEDLIIRENTLATQQRSLQIAAGIIKNNGNI